MSRVLVTGATGFIGSGTLCAAAARGFRGPRRQLRRERSGLRLRTSTGSERTFTTPRRPSSSWPGVAPDPSAAPRVVCRAGPVLALAREPALGRGQPASAARLRPARRTARGVGRQLRRVRLAAARRSASRVETPCRAGDPLRREQARPAADRRELCRRRPGSASPGDGCSSCSGRGRPRRGSGPSVAEAVVRGQPAPCSHGEQVRDFLYSEDLADAFVALLQLVGPGADQRRVGRADAHPRSRAGTRRRRAGTPISRASARSRPRRASRPCSSPTSPGCATRWAGPPPATLSSAPPTRSTGGARTWPRPAVADRPLREMRIVHVTPELPHVHGGGGGRAHELLMCRRMVELGHQVLNISPVLPDEAAHVTDLGAVGVESWASLRPAVSPARGRRSHRERSGGARRRRRQTRSRARDAGVLGDAAASAEAGERGVAARRGDRGARHGGGVGSCV